MSSLLEWADYTIVHHHLPEQVVAGKRLGRHVRHDSRSLAYPYRKAGPELATILIQRYIPILNQGDVGCCTTNALVGALGTGSLYGALTQGYRASLNEALCLNLYSKEEQALGYGPYPPNDDGGDGLAAAGIGKTYGYISGYTHCLSLDDVLTAISDGNQVMIGSNWYDSFDSPAGSGLVSISPNAVVRGGHEYLGRGINVEDKLIFCDNSWDNGWGLQGSFVYSWDTLDRLLSEQGDGTVPVALSQPEPDPQPVGSS